MSYREVEHFLRDHSSNQTIRDTFKVNVDKAVEGYGLTPEEIAMLKRGDKAEIRKYLVDGYSAAIMIQIP